MPIGAGWPEELQVSKASWRSSVYSHENNSHKDYHWHTFAVMPFCLEELPGFEAVGGLTWRNSVYSHENNSHKDYHWHTFAVMPFCPEEVPGFEPVGGLTRRNSVYSRSFSELTTPPTYNHAPPPTKSRKSYQSVNPSGTYLFFPLNKRREYRWRKGWHVEDRTGTRHERTLKKCVYSIILYMQSHI